MQLSSSPTQYIRFSSKTNPDAPPDIPGQSNPLLKRVSEYTQECNTLFSEVDQTGKSALDQFGFDQTKCDLTGNNAAMQKLMNSFEADPEYFTKTQNELSRFASSMLSYAKEVQMHFEGLVNRLLKTNQTALLGNHLFLKLGTQVSALYPKAIELAAGILKNPPVLKN